MARWISLYCRITLNTVYVSSRVLVMLWDTTVNVLLPASQSITVTCAVISSFLRLPFFVPIVASLWLQQRMALLTQGWAYAQSKCIRMGLLDCGWAYSPLKLMHLPEWGRSRLYYMPKSSICLLCDWNRARDGVVVRLFMVSSLVGNGPFLSWPRSEVLAREVPSSQLWQSRQERHIAGK